MSTRLYTLHKCRKILRTAYSHYKRKRKKLSQDVQKRFESNLLSLQETLQKKDREQANLYAKEIEKLSKMHLHKSLIEQGIDLVLALAFALVVAIAIRQMWFEFYVIPTGSMRPTLKEQDYLFVSKTDFGINTPLRTSHFYFDQDLVKRGGIVVFSGENMDIRDVDTVYFYILPGKKQYVKRLIAKPGDIIYFYGGKLYGLDKQGNEIKDFYGHSWFEKIEHIPFIHFEGKVQTSNAPTQGVYTPAILYQMNQPIAKLYVTPFGQPAGEMLPMPRGSKNVAPPKNYGDLWGMKNYGMARLLTKEQAARLTSSPVADDGILYLEITHHPSLNPPVIERDEYNRVRPALHLSSSLLPLNNEQIARIFSHLYTARFFVKNGYAYRYGVDKKGLTPSQFDPQLPGVPDGTYEFQDGKAHQIVFAGISKELPPSHPLYQNTPERTQLLYNLGIEFDNHFAPKYKNQPYVPSRYVYFRDGDLYLMGYPIITKDEQALKQFVQNEQQKADGFFDAGSPIRADGTLDKELIQKNGLSIPDGMYLVLGDNHAMSADSRVFGFVPEANLRGGASFIFWPTSSRWGALPQPIYPWVNLPKVVIFAAFVIILLISMAYYKRKFQKPLKF